MKSEHKVYTPVTEFERATGDCPLYLAWQVLDEAQDYFRVPIAEGYAGKLARRAEVVFAKHPFWQRRFKLRHGRGAILASMRHWLAGVLARDRSALFRDLPESFKIGVPLPSQSASRPKRNRKRKSAARFFNGSVHGCEWLPI